MLTAIVYTLKSREIKMDCRVEEICDAKQDRNPVETKRIEE